MRFMHTEKSFPDIINLSREQDTISWFSSMFLLIGPLLCSGPGEQVVILGTLETSVTKVVGCLDLRGLPEHKTVSAKTGKLLTNWDKAVT